MSITKQETAPGLNLGKDNRQHKTFCGFPQYLQAIAGIGLQLGHEHSQILSNSSFMNHPIIQYYTVVYTDSIVK
jgi:hypothetical protein